MRTIYLPERKSHWSFNESESRKAIAKDIRKTRLLERCKNLALGAAVAGAILGQDAKEILRAATKQPTSRQSSIDTWL